MEMSLAKKPRLSTSLLSVAQERVCGQVDRHTWDALPLEVLHKIIVYLNPKDRRAAGLVCTHWYTTLSIPSLWKHSWIFVKPGLKSRSLAFWSKLQQRGYNKFAVHGKKFVNDLCVIGDKLEHRVKGLKLFISQQSIVSLEVLHTFSSLQILHLEFMPNNFTSSKWITSIRFTNLNSLTELKLYGIADLCMHNFEFLSHPKVQSVSIESCGSFRSNDTTKIIHQFPSLVKLSFVNCVYYHDFITPVSSCPLRQYSIKHLNLERTAFGTIGQFFPCVFSDLCYMNLHFCLQEPRNLISILSSLLFLEEIDLRGNRCTDQVLSSLVCKKLRKIDLAVNQDITIKGVSHLSVLAKDTITFLGLGFCMGVMMRQKQFVHNLHNLFPLLQYLNLSGWRLTRDQLQIIVTNNKSLKELTVSSLNGENDLSLHLNPKTVIHRVSS